MRHFWYHQKRSCVVCAHSAFSSSSLSSTDRPSRPVSFCTEDSADATKEFYAEYRSVCDMTAEFYLQTIDVVFQDHALPRGTMVIKAPPGLTYWPRRTERAPRSAISGSERIDESSSAKRSCVFKLLVPVLAVRPLIVSVVLPSTKSPSLASTTSEKGASSVALAPGVKVGLLPEPPTVDVVVPRELPGIAVLQPVVRVLRLLAGLDALFERLRARLVRWSEPQFDIPLSFS